MKDIEQVEVALSLVLLKLNKGKNITNLDTGELEVFNKSVHELTIMKEVLSWVLNE